MSSPAQQALDIATQRLLNLQGGAMQPGTKQSEMDIYTCIQLLAEGVLGTTPSSDTIDQTLITNDVSTTTPVATDSGG
jgi:hypothetical protein